MPAAPAVTSHKALNSALAQRTFERVYYFHGDDDFLKDEAIAAILDAAVEPSTRDFNLDVRRGNELDAAALETMLSTMPMLAERRVVVLRDVQGLKKAVRGVLDRYLAQPSADTVLICCTPGGVKIDTALAKKADSFAFEPLTEERTRRWVAHYAQDRLGRAIDTDAADLLVRAAGTGLLGLASELDKLASYAAGEQAASITADAVADVVGVRRGETMADLLDAVAARDAVRALDMLPHVLSQPKTSGVQLVIALGTQFLGIAYCAARLEERAHPAKLAGELFQMMKEGGAFTARPWGEATQAWMRAAPQWSTPRLDAAIARLADADAALKETRVSSEEQVLASLVLALCR
ncbi:MAG: DNA polymerase III subunit delta [Gemmatimonadaceae bacterium]|jgi:DNA polymerase-3 subunit delta|nr:DNA polymerase III subunit delta [Gemmatimonadaceae bacterium]